METETYKRHQIEVSSERYWIRRDGRLRLVGGVDLSRRQIPGIDLGTVRRKIQLQTARQVIDEGLVA